MIVVLQSSGNVAVTADGKIKLASESPVPAGCCCDLNPCQTCDTCDPQRSLPTTLYLTLSGVLDGTCTNCDAFNATWELTLNTETCRWTFSDGPELTCQDYDPATFEVEQICQNGLVYLSAVIQARWLGVLASWTALLESADFCNAAFEVSGSGPSVWQGGESSQCAFGFAGVITIGTSPP